MQFSEKLDFLMNITKTTNSALSLNIKLDASHISRLRRGQRRALKDEACIKAMASFFSRHCEADYQRKAVSDALNIGQFSFDADKVSDLIVDWLRDEKTNELKTVGNFLTGFSSAAQRVIPAIDIPEKTLNKTNTKGISVFYGVDGKRQAVICFLSAVLARKKPQTLLLFSDETTDWMTEDREFTMKWASLMSQVLKKGHKIKIIHTISRDLDEMLNAISQWMPLYMTGAIEPYFYPKKRDGIFKQTLFIAPETVAVVSSSVGYMLNQAANLLFKDTSAIKAFEEEFYQYLKLCKPLMHIFTSKDQKEYYDTLLEFEKEESHSIIKTESLSLLTMPKAVASSIVSRLEENALDLIDCHKSRIVLFENTLRINHVSEIIQLPDVNTVIASKVKVAFSDMLSGSTAYYTAEEYILHLEHLVFLLKNYDKFHVYLTVNIAEELYMVYAKEDLGVIVAKTSAPPVVLAINENNMTAAFWDFLKSMICEKDFHEPNNAETIKKLTEYIQLLKQTAR